MDCHTAYLGLGSNLGDRFGYFCCAVAGLNSKAQGEVSGSSSVYETQPVDMDSPNRFLNAAVRFDTRLSPEELLACIHDIENEFGRERVPGAGYLDRTIDIDLLAYDDLVIRGTQLTVPHPKMHERLFVMVPMSELAGGFVHPVLRKTMIEIRSSLPAGELKIWKEANWHAQK